MRFMLNVSTFVLLFGSIGVAQAQVTPMDWHTTASGSLGSVDVSFTGLSSTFLAIHSGVSLDSTDYSAAPLSNVEVLEYGYNNEWSATFSQPVTGLLLYGRAWRGAWSAGDDLPVEYTFDRPFSILSGFSNATVSGTTLILDDDVVLSHDGILQFPDTFNALSVSVVNAFNESGQDMTFAIPVPEPSSLVLASLALLGLFAHGWRRRRA